jgi:hypothetical protein
MTKHEILNSLIDEHGRTDGVNSYGDYFCVDHWRSYCSTCKAIVNAEDSGEWISRVFACDCRSQEENEDLVSQRNELLDDIRQAEFWESERKNLMDAEARWSEGWIA